MSQTCQVEAILHDITFKVIPFILIIILTIAMSGAAIYTFGNNAPLPKTSTKAFIILTSVFLCLYLLGALVLYIRRRFYGGGRENSDADAEAVDGDGHNSAATGRRTPLVEVPGESATLPRVRNQNGTDGPTGAAQQERTQKQYLAYVPGALAEYPIPHLSIANTPGPGTHPKSKKYRRLESSPLPPEALVDSESEARLAGSGRTRKSSGSDRSPESGSVSSLTTVDLHDTVIKPVQEPNSTGILQMEPGKAAAQRGVRRATFAVESFNPWIANA